MYLRISAYKINVSLNYVIKRNPQLMSGLPRNACISRGPLSSQEDGVNLIKNWLLNYFYLHRDQNVADL